MSTKPTITAEALAMARDHPLAESEQFLITLSENLARLHHTATSADRVGVLNRVTAEQAHRADADEIANARTEATVAERQRIEAILMAKEAEGRETVAQALAFQSEMPAAAAIEALRSAPKASSWATQPAQPTEPIEGLLRSADAPGGLVIMGQDGKPALAEQAVVSMSPSSLPRADENGAKRMWRDTIAAINRETSGTTATK